MNNIRKFKINRNMYHVIYGYEGIRVCKHLAKRASWKFTKVNDAVNFLRRRTNKDFQICVHNKDGSVRRMINVKKPTVTVVNTKNRMSAEHERHLQRVKDVFCDLLDKKYRKGVAEHGGKVWDKKHLLEMGLEEVLDLSVYLISAIDQVKKSGVELGKLEDNDV